nr:LOW QUALITY PROTEIN: brain-enriched guanylate kinase-associated protein [Misgurnus anguillicaudatus]
MPNGSSKATGVTVNRTLVSYPRMQPKPKTTSSRQERGSSSSTNSCPVFSGRQSNKDPSPRCPPSLISPTLREYCSMSSLKGSPASLKGSAFHSSNLSLQTCSPSTSLRNSSQRSSSEDDSWDTNSWSSGATCLLRSTIKHHSEDVFRARQPEGTSDSETGCRNSDSHKGNAVGSESREGPEKVAVGRRDSERSLTSSQGTSGASTISAELEEKIEAKLRFSQFLDEVTCRVLDPECLQAFGVVREREVCPQTSLTSVSSTHLCMDNPWLSSARDSWARYMPSCKILDSSETLRDKQEKIPCREISSRAYLETDIDQVRREHEISSELTKEMEKRTLQLKAESSREVLDSKRSPISNRSDCAPRPPHRSTSLPRPLSNNLAADVEDVCGKSSPQEQTDDLRRCLNYTTHKLHLLENEFDSTRQYLETELRRAQREFKKSTEKLHRIHSGYTAVQRINQELQDKILRMTKLHEEEIRSLSREILVLNNQLIDAKITVQKLQEQNLPADFQGRVEKHDHGRNVAPCYSRSDSIIGKRRRNRRQREAVRSLVHSAHKAKTQSFCGTNDSSVNHDLYRSDTALYCRSERWPERRQSVDLQNCVDGNTEDETLHLSFCPFRGFMVESLPVTGSYSSFSAASEEEARLTSCQRLWPERDYECENTFSYEKDSPGFPQSEGFHHVSLPASCYGASYRLPEDEATARRRQTSVEDVKTFSLPSSGPLSRSEQHYVTAPTKLKLGSFYRSIQDKDDVFHTRVLNSHISASTTSSPVLNPKTSSNVFRAETRAAFRNFEEKQQQTEDHLKQNDVNESSSESLNQSLEASMIQIYKKDVGIHPGAQKNTHQKSVNTGLSRKDSLTKAQLYGTLLN